MQLNLRVLSCSNIPRPEDVISIDPYISFNLNFCKNSQKTLVIDSTFDPVWKQDFEIPINPNEYNFGIDISLCSRDVFNEDFEIGSVTGIVEDLKPYEIREVSFEINIVDIDKEKREAELLSKEISPNHIYTPKFLPRAEQKESKNDTKEESNKKKGTYATFVFQIAPKNHPPFTKEGTPPRPLKQPKISNDSFRKNNSSYFIPSSGHYISRGGYDKYPYPQRIDRPANFFSFKSPSESSNRFQFRPSGNFEFSQNSYKPTFHFGSSSTSSRFGRNRDANPSSSIDDSMPKPYFSMNSRVTRNDEMKLTSLSPRKEPTTRRFNFDFSPNRNRFEDTFSTLDSASRTATVSSKQKNSSFESFEKAYNTPRVSLQNISHDFTNTTKPIFSFDKNGKQTSDNSSPQKYDFHLNERGGNFYNKARDNIQIALKSLANANQPAQNSSLATNKMNSIYLNKDQKNKTQMPLEKSDQNNKTQKPNNSDKVPNYGDDYFSNLLINSNLQLDDDYNEEDEDEDNHSYRNSYINYEDSDYEDEDENENDYSDMEEDNFNRNYSPVRNNNRKRTSFMPSSKESSQTQRKFLSSDDDLSDLSDDGDVIEIAPPKSDKEPAKPPKSSTFQQRQPIQQTSQNKVRANSAPKPKSQTIPPVKETDEKNENSNKRDIRFTFGPTGNIKFVFNNSNNNDNEINEVNQQNGNTSENARPVVVRYQAQKKGNSKKKSSRDNPKKKSSQDNSPNNSNNN